MGKLIILLFLPAIIFCFRARLLEDECPPLNQSYAIYLIDTYIKPQENCNYTLTLVTGDCAYASSAIKPNENSSICIADSSIVCDGVDTNVLGGFVTIHCGDKKTVEQFEPVLDYSMMKEFQIKSPNVEANVMVGSACNKSIDSDPMHWGLSELRTCQVPIEAEAQIMGVFVPVNYGWGYGGRRFGRRYSHRCRGRGWRGCWRW